MERRVAGVTCAAVARAGWLGGPIEQMVQLVHDFDISPQQGL
jgi:hypothetical protein